MYIVTDYNWNVVKILIVEDSPERTAFFLNLYRFQETMACSTAEDANLQICRQNFDIIHLDYDLAGARSGVDVAQMIRKEQVNAAVIVHSENSAGAKEIQKVLPDAIFVPFSALSGRGNLPSRLKALLSAPRDKTLSTLLSDCLRLELKAKHSPLSNQDRKLNR